MKDVSTKPPASDDFNDRIAGLSPAKRALLELRLKKSRASATVGRTIARRSDRESAPPLSFAQQRLWFLNQLEPNSTLYHITTKLRLRGQLNVEALQKSLATIVERHEALRTTFASSDGEPVQVINANPGVALAAIDLSTWSKEDRELEVQRLLKEEARRPFNLSSDVMLRSILIRLSEEENVLLLVMHHIASDGWSIGVLFRELSALYDAFCNEKPSPLPELAIQYADYAIWQRQWLQGDVLEKQLSYWRNQLKDISTLQLPTDRPRPVVQSHRGARQSLTLSKELTENLKALSRKEGASLFMMLLAAFQILLHRLTGQDDIAVGSPIAGRNRSEIEGLIGFFLNTLVLRTHLSGNPRFTELLARVRRGCLDAYAHQDVPFEKLLEEFRPERDLSRTPLFQVFFNMLNSGDNGTLNLPGLTKELLQSNAPTSKFDLTLYSRDTNGSLWFSLVYNPDLFEPATIGRLLGHYHTLLLGIAANPQERISSLPLLSEEERTQLSARRNSVAPTNPFVEFKKEDIEQSIPGRFEQIAKVHPDRIAVKTRNYQWTYAELNAKANQIAQAILRSSDSDEGRIGLLFEHDAPMIAGILGALKAGKTYVPLDPAYPSERLSYILEDSQTTAIATNSGNVALAHRLINGSLQLINIDEFECSALIDDFSSPTAPDRLAYILYTSGSTGRPKGVMQNHRNVLHHIRNYTNNLHLNSDDRLTLLSSYGFDAAVMDLFGALLNGAALHPMDIREEDPSALLSRMLKENITIYHSTPTVYRYLMSSLTGSEDLSHVRFVVLGGEKVHKEDVDRFKKVFSPHSILVNGLGPTESTVTLQYFINHKTEITGNIVPVGYPVEDTQVLLLNEAGEHAEVYGEIGIKSEHVALGYWQKPELTKAAFLPDSESATKRIYRTGDLGRLLPDGSITFVGRKDDQVKIRGYRIEPGEVESVLSTQSGVRECVVMAREEVPDEIRLVAYLVARSEPAPTPSELRSFVKSKLPDYMVPSQFVYLDALPLTPNGKVDQRALPAPAQSQRELDESVSAPGTPVEEMLAGIWAELLKLENIGIHDNFFDLGGHSLLATQVTSRLREVFQIELPLRSLFETPTVAGLAESIEEARRKEQNFSVVPIVPVTRESELPLSFAQERLWFLDQLQPGSSVYNLSGAFRLLGLLDSIALERSLNEIVRRHEALRTTFKSVEGLPHQVVAAQVDVPLALIDLSERYESDRESEARRCAAEAVRRPFDLSRGPLLRTTLLRLSQEEHVLLLEMHHIVSDGWSMGILFRELSILYETFSNGKPSPLTELPIQYVDYAVWQRNWLRGEVLETQLSYWKKQLENISPLNLPTDRPRPAVQSFDGAREALVLSTDLTQALKAVSRKEGATLFMTLLAAFQILLHRLTGQDDIAVGSPIAGRNRSEIEGLIGFFLNTLVLRTDLSGNPTFTELLARVRRRCLEAYAHQDVPFEKLLEELRPERDLSRTPLFQVFFNMVNVAERAKPEGLKIETISAGRVESKFDLTIYVRERDGSLHLNWVYNADLFQRDRIREMLSQYEKLLSQILQHPAASIHSYSLLTEAAQELLPNPVEPLGSDWFGSVHDRFSLQARWQPDHLAITEPYGSWTYAELNARSNQLAHHLLEKGIRREDVVAVYAHRSASIVWALLGILKAGAAFLILDPAYPTARLIGYLRAAKPRAFIRLEAAAAIPAEVEEIIETTDCRRINLPGLSAIKAADFLERYSKEDPAIAVGPNDLAGVSFTSGSTGAPKGILCRHGSLSQFLPWQADRFSLTSADRFSLLSGLSHDPLQREIFTSLWVGATICIPDPDIMTAPGELARWMAQQKITFAHLTPALSRLLTETADPACQLLSLRYAFFVGDKLTWVDVDGVRSLAPNVICVNSYGSTETQRAVSYYEVSPDMTGTSRNAVIPVGKGMPGVQLLVLNPRRNLAGVGEIGEIYMRSPHLARGYLNDDRLTRERFITSPFNHQASDRLYKTGDLGHYLPDGSVEILGRGDEQVKIRGFRVELGEIESVLKQHSNVGAALVRARQRASNDKRLAAYIVANQASSATIAELHSFLKQRLPSYMVPSEFVFLDSLPLTPNGKLDETALAAFDQSSRGIEKTFVPPRTPTERMLASIWAELLGLNQVSVNENFFELGGHSLLTVRLLAEIEKVFKTRPPLATLFQEGTIEHLAQLISQGSSPGIASRIIPIQPKGDRLPFFCVHELFGNVLCYTNLARNLGPDQPFYAIEARGLDGAEEPFFDIEAMSTYYIDQMRAVQPRGPYALGGLCFGGLVAFEMARQLRENGESVKLVALLDSGIKSGRGKASGWRVFETIPMAIPSWLTGALQLNAAQWLDLVKLKRRQLKAKLAAKLGRRNGEARHPHSTSFINEMADLFGFSEQQRKIAYAQHQAIRKYIPRSYPGRLTLFRAQMQPLFSSHRPDKGWRRVAAGGLDVKVVPGNHLGMLQEPHVKILAKELRACLD
jgi:amino acid adenylation domain-containing protein